MNTVTREVFGKTATGEVVERFTLQNDKDVTVRILSLGGIIQSIFAPDKHGKILDVTLGYDDLSGYEDNPCYFGALVGRVANRIHKGKFTLDGQTYQLAVNNGPNHLHGGPGGFHQKLWQARVDGSQLVLSLTSRDGEEGYPGELAVTVTYELTADSELVIDYTATTTKATPINLTSHPYFNLAGHKHKDVYDQVVTVFADRFTPKVEDGVPSGEIATVANTVFDLREGVMLGERIQKVPDDLGYDHNFCVEGDDFKKLAARAYDPASGRTLECFTNQPGVQLYTGNYVDVTGKDGTKYSKHSAFCLETQNYPDAVNNPNFPKAILRPGETYRHTTWYRFSCAS